MKPHYRKPKPSKKPPRALDLVDIKAYLPPWLMSKVREISVFKGIPMSRLIGVALDNELLREIPFECRTIAPLPHEVPVKKFEYADQANKLAKWLRQFPRGVDRELMILCRKDYGVESREEVLLAWRELFIGNLVEDVKPDNVTKFRYPETTEFVRLKGVSPRELYNERKEMRETKDDE